MLLLSVRAAQVQRAGNEACRIHHLSSLWYPGTSGYGHITGTDFPGDGNAHASSLGPPEGRNLGLGPLCILQGPAHGLGSKRNMHAQQLAAFPPPTTEGYV